MLFFLMSQGSFSLKIRFLCQKVCSVARGWTDGRINRQTRKWKQRTPFQGFRIFFKFYFNLIIKERSNIVVINLVIQLFYNLVNNKTNGVAVPKNMFWYLYFSSNFVKGCIIMIFQYVTFSCPTGYNLDIPC